MSSFVKYLRYTLTLRAPAILTTLSGDPNSSTTQPFIPGGAIRGAFAGELLDKGVSAISDDFRRLILDGNVRFLHAYPGNGSVRSLPAPISWRKEKGVERTSAIDLAAYTGLIDPDAFSPGDDDELQIEPVEACPTKQLQRVEFPFVEFSGSTTRGVRVRTDSRSHQQRDRVKGRSRKTTHDDGSEEAHGALFAYEFLESDQTFHGVIQVLADSDDEATGLINQIREILNQRPIFIGRSRRAGYGGSATIEFSTTERREAHWGDVQQDDVPAGSLFRAYLLSACIARDPFTGQFDPGALSRRLVVQLGGEDVVSFERLLWDFETIGGFNRKWKLEVPQALAAKAGSVLVLRAKQMIPASTLSSVEQSGLGERRIEGFGRLVFLKHTDSPTVALGASALKPYSTTQPSTDPPELVRFVQRRLLDAAFSRTLDRRTRRIIGDLENANIPTGSLLGRLRIPLRTGDPVAGLQTLQQWLDETESKRRTAFKEEAQKKLRNCRLANGLNLRDWLIQTANAVAGTQAAVSDLVQRRLQLLDFTDRDDPEQAAVSDLVQRRLQLGANEQLAKAVAEERRAAYAVRLIDAVLATLARKARRRGRETES